MNTNKSAGYTDIPIVLFKEAKFIICPLPNRVIQQMPENRPLSWCFKNYKGKIATFHKGRSKLKLGNYQPISILSLMNKVFETILHSRTNGFWEKYDLFTNCQFGFRKKDLTAFTITYLHEIISEERDANTPVTFRKSF